MTPEQKKEIDDMSQYDMCSLWRFAKTGHPLLINGDTEEYFSKGDERKGRLYAGNIKKVRVEMRKSEIKKGHLDCKL